MTMDEMTLLMRKSMLKFHPRLNINKDVPHKYSKYMHPREDDKNDSEFTTIIKGIVRHEIDKPEKVKPAYTSPSPKKRYKYNQASSKKTYKSNYSNSSTKKKSLKKSK